MKPGWKTSEFWLSAAACLLGLLVASGVVAEGGTLDKAIGLAVSGLSALGYTYVRGTLKSGG